MLINVEFDFEVAALVFLIERAFYFKKELKLDVIQWRHVFLFSYPISRYGVSWLDSCFIFKKVFFWSARLKILIFKYATTTATQGKTKKKLMLEQSLSLSLTIHL